MVTEVCPGFRLFSSILALYPLDAISIPFPPYLQL